MNNDPDTSTHSSRAPTPPRIFSILYLGDGRYALDRIELPNSVRRVRTGRSISAMRRALAKLAGPGDTILMSEALRALELLGAPATQRRTIERVCGSEFFQYIQTVERVPGASGDGTDPTAEQPPMVRVDFIRDMPRSRFDGGFWEAASPEQDGGDPSDN